MTKKTDQKALDKLYDIFVDFLRKKLDEDTATAADLAVIRGFLKDNGIEFVSQGNADEDRQRLADILPFKADDAEAA